MNIRIIAIVMFLLASNIAWAETTVTNTEVFGAWRVIIPIRNKMMVDSL
ncbi:MAG: hypothetical protein JRD69_04560 [Deltaproteobacteria bacterium]|nr:hypothetical protein [Deltaproteobacteria bacterium]